jgi:hypothetical protein
VELRGDGPPLHVVIDTAERYAWRFPSARVERRKLAVGDYALLDGERLVAVVERKSFDNLLTDIASIQALHQQLADLASHEHAALVIEAQYADFVNPKRLAGRWPAVHLARVLAELSAMHATLPVIFAGNRKLANAWTQRFFEAVALKQAGPPVQLQLDVEQRYDAYPRRASVDEQIRVAILEELADSFRFTDLAEQFPDVQPHRLRRVLTQLREERQVKRTGEGRAARWSRVGG